MPRWVKISLIIAAVVAVLVAILKVSGHGPSQHMGSTVELPAHVVIGKQ